jgi:SAM-dependent methyltransferase
MLKQDDRRYSSAFFGNIDQGSAPSAREVVPFLLRLIEAKSVIDVGCGPGSWLREFQEQGITDYLGVDGDYVDRNHLVIPAERFMPVDLKQPLVINRKFDLVVCLEVAEHLPPESASTLVQSIAALTDIVVFSAAIPFQRGQNHLNLQWPGYWADLFASHGFDCYDCVRPIIWENDKVEAWFSQNILIYCRPTALHRLRPQAFPLEFYKGRPRGMVHPRHYMFELDSGVALHELREVPLLGWTFRALALSLKSSIRFRLGRLLGTGKKNS